MTVRYIELARPGRDTGHEVIPISYDPQGGVLELTRSDGLQHLHRLGSFWDPTVDFGEVTYELEQPVDGDGVWVPSGWIARIYLITLACGTFGGDITAVTGKLLLSNTATNVTDSFSALTLAAAGITSCEPLAPPFEVTGGAADDLFQVFLTTNGTSGTVEVKVDVYGYLYKPVT